MLPESGVASLDELNLSYMRVARAIGYLRAHYRQQPPLRKLATHLGLSEFHVQRLFSRWVGISPKRFVQFLTAEYAKQRMAETRDLLSLSLDAGLSGPGRLHDLFVTMEAMSPGEFKRAADGVRIHYGVSDTPFGLALIATTPRGICHLSFVDAASAEVEIHNLRRTWPGARFGRDPHGSASLLARAFTLQKKPENRPLLLCVSGSNFQIQVWRALLRIPFAGMLSYRQLAGLLGRPKAARAVGNAVARNPVAYLIPCHRVLRQSGDFGKYYWGEERKAAILAWEASNGSIDGE